MTLKVFLLILTAAVCHALWNYAVRKVTGNLLILWLALWAGLIMLLPILVGTLLLREMHTLYQPSAAWCVIASGVVHALYFILLARAYEYGELSLVYPLARGSGIGLAALMAWVVLRETISFYGACGIFLICAGVFLLGVRMSRTGDSGKGYFFALSVGLCISLYSLIDKVGVGRMHPVLYMWCMVFLATILLSPWVLRTQRDRITGTAMSHAPAILLIGGGSLGTYLMILFALTMAPVSYIVAVREFAVVAGAFLGFVFLREKITVPKVTAIVLITAGLVLIKTGG